MVPDDITPEQSKRSIVVMFIRALLFPMSMALLGTMIAMGYQNDVKEIVIFGIITGAVMLTDFLLGHLRD